MNSLAKHLLKRQSPQIVSAPSRSIIFMRRLQNKPVKKESNTRHNYDEDTYIKGMKKFQKEARGLVPGTPEYTMVRNKIYTEMRITQGREEASQKFTDAAIMMPDFSSFYVLMVVTPESTECYETMHILKYFDFPVNVEEDNILRQQVKIEMGFRKEDEVS